MNASKAKLFACAVLLLAIGGPALDRARGQMVTPLHIGNTQPVYDEFGCVLAGYSGQPGGFVMVLWASNSVIHPPQTNGQPHADNPPVAGGLAAIGQLTAPGPTNPGLFSVSLADPRPPEGSRVFVRAFNRESLEASSFYADSQLFSASGNQVFDAVLGGTTNALDGNDPDGDGLHNSWEKSYGSDPEDTDSDGDGLQDGFEHTLGASPVLADSDGDLVIDSEEWRAGTDLRNGASFLGLAALVSLGDGLHLQWASITGRQYQVEWSDDGLSGSPAFTNATEVVAASTGTVTEVVLTNALEGADLRSFRVRLVEE
jgi:hypothetical protein